MKIPPSLADLLWACLLVFVLAATALALPATPEGNPPGAGAANPAGPLDGTVFSPPSTADPARLDYRLQARALAPGVWVVEGANADFSLANGCNIINTGFIASGAGVVVVNTGPSRRYGEQLRSLIARTTPEPVVQVVQLNLHPDYFLGNQAFADLPRYASAETRAGVAREAAAYEANLFRLCGDWMSGTEALPPDHTVAIQPSGKRWRVGQREFEWLALQGHTASDLVLIVHGLQGSHGSSAEEDVAFVGGLAFSQRIPTTPHAEIVPWLASLDQLARLPLHTVVPSHGPVFSDGSGIQQTQRYLRWLDGHFRRAALAGWDMNELLRAPVPDEYQGWAAFQTEYLRNVAHLYPRYERAALGAPQANTAR